MCFECNLISFPDEFCLSKNYCVFIRVSKKKKKKTIGNHEVDEYRVSKRQKYFQTNSNLYKRLSSTFFDYSKTLSYFFQLSTETNILIETWILVVLIPASHTHVYVKQHNLIIFVISGDIAMGVSSWTPCIIIRMTIRKHFLIHTRFLIRFPQNVHVVHF